MKGVLAFTLGVGTLGAAAAGVTTVAASAVASATTSPLVCHKFWGYFYSTVYVTSCGLPTKAHFAATNLLSGGTLTWGKSTATTTYAGVATSAGQGACATGHVGYDFTGSVTADTSGHVTVGDLVTYDICVNTATGVIKLLHRTVASF